MAKVSSNAPLRSASRLSTHVRAGGLYQFEDVLATKTTVSATFVTCTAWLLELYELKGGAVFFLTGVGEVRSRARCFAALFPPFSIARLRIDRARGRVLGFAGTTSLLPTFSETPMLLELPAARGAMLPSQIVQSATTIRPIPAWPHASALSRRAKSMIDQSYRSPVSLAHVASRLGVTASHLSRQFKRDFAMTPSAYLRQLRLADAPLRLARGEAIGAISHDVGYADLSRFYKQFRKTTRTSPGECRAMIAPDRGHPRVR